MPQRYRVTGMTATTSERPLVTAADAAKQLGVSVRTLDRYQGAGLIQPIRAIHNKGARRQFDAADIARLAGKP
ncbi:helix-turn-helix DNA binding domain protein [Arthrobacter phage SerialPhiller]|nr:helix-turn-helix DNA binding domain protein [Arthrobacter phage Arielagos]WNT45251.1 helix-turn-helix DNA binding domain protein [Arthrobacter phage SerialPhiller]